VLVQVVLERRQRSRGRALSWLQVAEALDVDRDGGEHVLQVGSGLASVAAVSHAVAVAELYRRAGPGGREQAGGSRRSGAPAAGGRPLRRRPGRLLARATCAVSSGTSPPGRGRIDIRVAGPLCVYTVSGVRSRPEASQLQSRLQSPWAVGLIKAL
jgi:hypothetical protein